MDTLHETQIIYDDDDIRVLWLDGTSPFLLITFGDLLFLARHRRFFAEAPVRKSNLACIGVMAKGRNWFPADSMQKAAPAILKVAARYAERVLYGGSMGGYAAVKYSALLGGTVSIALCPQWSIDAAECLGTDPGWQADFRPRMRHMGIRPDEVSGAVYVFSDPLERRDAFHRRMICRAYPKAQSVDVPMVGHHVTRVFAGTTNLLDVIEACQAGSRPELVRLARKLRVASIFRGRIVFERAYRQHALLLGRHLAPAARRDPQLALSYEPHFFRCAGVLAAQSNVRRLRQFDDEFGDCLATANGRILWAALVNHVQGRESRLISFHQKEIAYSTRTGACVQAPFGTAYKPGDVPVRMHLAGSQMMLYVMLGDVRVDLWPDAQGLLSPHYGAVPGLPFPAFNVTPLGRGAFALEANGKYLSAEPHGRVICDRPVAQRWESFRIDGAAT